MKMGTCAPGSAAENWKMPPRGGGVKALAAIAMTIAIALCVPAVLAEEGGGEEADEPIEYDDKENYCKYDLYENQGVATLKQYYGNSAEVSIQGTVSVDSESGTKTYTVTKIGDAFSQNDGLTKVIIPVSVETIEDSDYGAFFKCHNLEEVKLGNGLKNIGQGAFYECTSLERVTMGTAVETIGRASFDYCSALKEIEFPKLRSIGGYAFAEVGLESIVIPDSVTTIGEYAFYQCPLTTLTLPDSEEGTIIGECAFLQEGEKGYSSIEIPAGITSIGERAFSKNVSSLTFAEGSRLTSFKGVFAGMKMEQIILPDSMKIIDSEAFSGCANLRSVVFGKNITTIKQSAFEGCSALTSMVNLDTITNIGGNAFKGCEKLTEIAIPDSVTHISSGVFNGCTQLSSVTFGKESKLESIGERLGGASFEGTAITSISLPGSLTLVGMCTFKDSNIQTVKFNTNAEGKELEICQWAFNANEWTGGNSELTTVTFSDSPVKIGYGAFMRCSKLTSVTFGKGEVTLGDDEGNSYAFMNSGLGTGEQKTIVIPNAKAIGDGAFYGLTGITGIEVQSGSVSDIGESAFYECASLATVNLPDNEIGIGDYAFTGTAITDIPWKVTSIGYIAFKGCTGLEDVSLPYLKEIGNRWGNSCLAFGECTNLKSISMPKVTYIDSQVFEGCSALEEVVMGKVEHIGWCAFDGCTALKRIVIGGSLNDLDENAFMSYDSEKPSEEQYEKVVTFYGGVDGQGEYTDELSATKENLRGFTFVGNGDQKLVKVCTLTLRYPDETKIEEYKCGETLARPEDPSTGTTFRYWAEKEEAGYKEFSFDNAKMPGRNVDLYPIFILTVAFLDDDGKTVYRSVNADTGDEVELPGEDSEIKKDGWVLVGWKIGSAAGDVHGIGEKFTADSNVNIDVIAEWYHGTDVVVFTAGGGELYGSTYAPLIDGKAVLETSVNPEYEEGKYNEFLGWIWTDGSGNEVIYAQNLTLRASGIVRLTPYIVDYYQADLRDIYYDYGVTEGRVWYQSAEVGKMVMLPTSDDAEYEGHRLAGWTENGASVASPYVVTSDGWYHQLSAVWESVSTVTFLDADGSLLKTFETVTGETIGLCDGEGMQQGSALVGWKADSSETILGLGTDYRIDSDIVFTAARIDAADVLIYVTSGGKMIGDTYSLIEGGSAVSDTRIEKDGFMFLGWLMTDSDGNNVAYANGMHIVASGVVRLNAYLVPEGTEVHKVAYDFNEGTGSVTIQEAEEGQLIALQTSLDVQREGYKLAGWEISPATAVAGPYYAVTSEDVTLTAVWESIEPGPSPEPPTPIWDDDDDDPYSPTPAYDGGSSGGSDKTRENVAAVAVAAAAAVVMAFLAIAVFRRK